MLGQACWASRFCKKRREQGKRQLRLTAGDAAAIARLWVAQLQSTQEEEAARQILWAERRALLAQRHQEALQLFDTRIAAVAPSLATQGQEKAVEAAEAEETGAAAVNSAACKAHSQAQLGFNLQRGATVAKLPVLSGNPQGQ